MLVPTLCPAKPWRFWESWNSSAECFLKRWNKICKQVGWFFSSDISLLYSSSMIPTQCIPQTTHINLLFNDPKTVPELSWVRVYRTSAVKGAGAHWGLFVLYDLSCAVGLVWFEFKLKCLVWFQFKGLVWYPPIPGVTFLRCTARPACTVTVQLQILHCNYCSLQMIWFDLLQFVALERCTTRVLHNLCCVQPAAAELSAADIALRTLHMRFKPNSLLT